MENGDFIAQMAQFSTVTGIAEMGESLKKFIKSAWRISNSYCY